MTINEQPTPTVRAVTKHMGDHRGLRICLRTPYAYKDVCKGLPGALWDKTERMWHIPHTPHSALSMYLAFRHCEVGMDEQTVELLRQAKAVQDAKAHKTATDLEDLPTATSAWTHQRQGFWFAADLQAAMLAMDMGTGKSLTAIGLLEHWKVDTVLIVCPKNVLRVWPKQFRDHALREWDVLVPDSRWTVARRAAAIDQRLANPGRTKPLAVCVNYEAAWRTAMAMVLLDHDWGCVIADESHRIKAPGGKASKFMGTLRDNARRRLCLTGTPMPHSPLDIYAQYRFLDPGIFGTSHNRFKNRYAIMGGFEGRQVLGYQHEVDLQEKIGTIAFFCKADDVLDLPEYHHLERDCDLGAKTRKAYDTLEADFILGVQDGTVTPKNALTKLLRLRQCTSGYLRDDSGRDHELGREKRDLLADVLEDLPPHEPVVVFCAFQHDLETVRQVAIDSGRRFGELSGRVNERSAEWGLTTDATMREDVDIIAVQIQAGGVGIDLTRAAYAIYYSVDFSLGNFEQSLKRVHRPGQTRPTKYVHLLATGTVDEKVYAALQARKNVVEAMIEAARDY